MQLKHRRTRLLTAGAPVALLASAMLVSTLPAVAQDDKVPPDEPQPPAFDIPFDQIPTRRFNELGQNDPTATEEQVRAGQRYLMDNLGLVRNFDYLHWVLTVDSVQDPETGEWDGGDLDGSGNLRAVTISGQCLFAGHSADEDLRPIQIFRLADDEIADPPVKVGEIQVPEGFEERRSDDSILLANMYTRADGTETIILARDISDNPPRPGGLWVYEIDPADCSLVAEAEGYLFGGDLHEMGLWVDPNNPYRHLVVTAGWGGSQRPDPYNEERLAPDVRVLAITDENTGEMLPHPIELAGFTLQDVGGPLQRDEANDGGIFRREGRYPDWSEHGINSPDTQSNLAHQTQFGWEGDRIYVAHGTAGLYVLNSEAIVNNSDADLAAGNAGCNFDSTNIYVDEVLGGQIDVDRIGGLTNDCLYMVFLDEPGVQEIIGEGDVVSFLSLLDRSRFDPFPSNLNSTGAHSANIVQNRYSMDAGSENRPAFAVMTTERSQCPGSFMWMLSLEVEAFPYPISAFGLHDNELANCLAMPETEPDGVTERRGQSLMNHNPTVMENLIFVSWYAHGIRVIDISNPFNMREVGHVVTPPSGHARSFPVIRNGIVYWSDNRTGIHIARYTGPRADELPLDDLVYQGASALPTR